MISILFGLISFAFSAETAVIRSPHASLVEYNQYISDKGAASYAKLMEENFQTTQPDSSPIDTCLEAIAFQKDQAEKLCFTSVQDLKKQLWTPQLRKVLVPFFERLESEKLGHTQLYRQLKVGLQDTKMKAGQSEIAIKEQRIFLGWLNAQPEWKDAHIFVNGVRIQESLPISHSSIVQWFVISNAGRTLSHIGNRASFQNFLAAAEDIRFLDCQSVGPASLDLRIPKTTEYFYDAKCVVAVKTINVFETEAPLARWQKSQQDPFAQGSGKVEKQSQFTKWGIAALLVVAVGSVALKNKQVSVRIP